MNFRDFFRKFNLDGLKINLGFLETEIKFEDVDRRAAWDLYIELITRVATQPLPQQVGDEKAALSSVYSLFASTREVLKKYGTDCYAFSRVAVIILNQVVRPFTAEWHRRALAGDLQQADSIPEFRTELEALQIRLRSYAKMLAFMAGVEDITEIQEE